MKLDFLFQLKTARFGQYTTWLLLVFALMLALTPVQYVPGPRSLDPATIISFLPVDLLTSPRFYVLIRWILIISAFGWMFRKYTPWTCWTTCISFMMLWALRMENTTESSHLFNLTTMLLVIHAMWFQFYDQPMRDSIERKTYWQDPLYPRWVFLLCVFYIGLFHTLAGLNKIHVSGLGWGNGLSLQLWTNMLGWENSALGQSILSSRTFARVLQVGVMIVETTALLALFSRHLRCVIGLLLIGLYIGILWVFADFGVLFNLMLVALFFLPFEQRINRDQKITSEL